MKLLAAALLVVMGGVSQVTVAPLFPLRGAVFECGLITIVALALTAGPRAAMVALPFTALAVGFASGRAPGLLLLAYLPLLPFAAYVEEARLPFGRYPQLLGVTVLGGLWCRGMLTLGAVAQGADLPLIAFVRDLLLPGILLDVFAFTLLYVPIRAVGRGADTLTLQRGRYAL